MSRTQAALSAADQKKVDFFLAFMEANPGADPSTAVLATVNQYQCGWTELSNLLKRRNETREYFISKPADTADSKSVKKADAPSGEGKPPEGNEPTRTEAFDSQIADMIAAKVAEAVAARTSEMRGMLADFARAQAEIVERLTNLIAAFEAQNRRNEEKQTSDAQGFASAIAALTASQRSLSGLIAQVTEGVTGLHGSVEALRAQSGAVQALRAEINALTTALSQATLMRPRAAESEEVAFIEDAPAVEDFISAVATEDSIESLLDGAQDGGVEQEIDPPETPIEVDAVEDDDAKSTQGAAAIGYSGEEAATDAPHDEAEPLVGPRDEEAVPAKHDATIAAASKTGMDALPDTQDVWLAKIFLRIVAELGDPGNVGVIEKAIKRVGKQFRIYVTEDIVERLRALSVLEGDGVKTRLSVPTSLLADMAKASPASKPADAKGLESSNAPNGAPNEDDLPAPGAQEAAAFAVAAGSVAAAEKPLAVVSVEFLATNSGDQFKAPFALFLEEYEHRPGFKSVLQYIGAALHEAGVQDLREIVDTAAVWADSMRRFESGSTPSIAHNNKGMVNSFYTKFLNPQLLILRAGADAVSESDGRYSTWAELDIALIVANSGSEIINSFRNYARGYTTLAYLRPAMKIVADVLRADNVLDLRQVKEVNRLHSAALGRTDVPGYIGSINCFFRDILGSSLKPRKAAAKAERTPPASSGGAPEDRGEALRESAATTNPGHPKAETRAPSARVFATAAEAVLQSPVRFPPFNEVVAGAAAVALHEETKGLHGHNGAAAGISDVSADDIQIPPGAKPNRTTDKPSAYEGANNLNGSREGASIARGDRAGIAGNKLDEEWGSARGANSLPRNNSGSVRNSNYKPGQSSGLVSPSGRKPVSFKEIRASRTIPITGRSSSQPQIITGVVLAHARENAERRDWFLVSLAKAGEQLIMEGRIRDLKQVEVVLKLNGYMSQDGRPLFNPATGEKIPDTGPFAPTPVAPGSGAPQTKLNPFPPDTLKYKEVNPDYVATANFELNSNFPAAICMRDAQHLAEFLVWIETYKPAGKPLVPVLFLGASDGAKDFRASKGGDEAFLKSMLNLRIFLNAREFYITPDFVTRYNNAPNRLRAWEQAFSAEMMDKQPAVQASPVAAEAKTESILDINKSNGQRLFETFAGKLTRRANVARIISAQNVGNRNALNASDVTQAIIDTATSAGERSSAIREALVVTGILADGREAVTEKGWKRILAWASAQKIAAPTP